MSGVPYRAIYKNTTIDPRGTVKHAREMGAEIVMPKMSFLQLVKKKGMPTRRARFCCEYLKEYKILDVAVQGIRRCESVSRKKRYSEDDPVICRIYGSKKNHVSVVLPILTWTDKDVKEFIEERGIKCHPLYYDEDGNFHPERRLGCVGCPLKHDRGVADYKANPKLLRQVVRCAIVWWDNHPNSQSRLKNFSSPYAMIAHNLFFETYQDFRNADSNMFESDRDWKTELESYFNIKLPNYDIQRAL